MTLVLAGFHGWNTQEAELPSGSAQEANVFPVIKPVVEKMASIGPELPTGVPGGGGLCGGRRVLFHPI